MLNTSSGFVFNLDADYEREQKTLENSTAELRKTVESCVESCVEQNINVRSFIKIIRRLTFTIILWERLRYPAKLQ